MTKYGFFYSFKENRAADTEFRESFRPTLKQLIDFLHGNEPIPLDLRSWLAEMLDENGRTQMRLKICQRKTGPSEGEKDDLRSAIAHRVACLREEGVKMDAILFQVAREFPKANGQPMSRRRIQSIWAYWKPAYEPDRAVEDSQL